MALLLFRGVIQAVLEATGAALAENSEIDMISKVEDPGLPHLCLLSFNAGLKHDAPHNLVGDVGITCKDPPAFEIYLFDDMSANSKQTFTSPSVGTFTIGFGAASQFAQQPLKGDAILYSDWYSIKSGGDIFNEIGLKDLGLDAILQKNCEGHYVDVQMGSFAYNPVPEYSTQSVRYNIVVPQLGAPSVCPS